MCAPSSDPAGRLAGSRAPLVRALAEVARAAPVDPALFFQDGLDWRFLDRGELAGRVLETHRRLLAGAGSLADLEVAYPSRPDPATLVLDLALQHAGAVPCPRAMGAGDGPGKAWVADARDPRPGPLPAPTAGLAARWQTAVTRGVEALSAAAARPLPARGPWSRRLGLAEPREVVVDVLELERPLCRSGVHWILTRGGALVLAHERSSLEASARWARPTRVWAETAEARFDRLVAALLSGRRTSSARLVSAVWSGAAPPGDRARAALVAAGVEVAEWSPGRPDADAGAGGPPGTR